MLSIVQQASPPQIVGAFDTRDSHTVLVFTIQAGHWGVGSVWRAWESIPRGCSLIVNEVTVVTAGGPDDVDTVVTSGTVQISDDNANTPLFERPLGLLTVRDAQSRDAEMDARLSRLERMMNVLVEQDSAAGEALRRLGGAKILYESPSRFTRPAKFDGGDRVGASLRFEWPVTLTSDVVVRVSLLGISTRPLL